MTFTATYDVVTYSNSGPGVMAACAAADQGVRSAIVSPESHLGGMMINGLSANDTGRNGTSLDGYLWAEFLDRVGSMNGSKRIHRLEPRTAEKALRGMMSSRGVAIFPNATLNTVSKTGANINSFTDVAGNIYVATQFIDGFYEGDLARAASVTMKFGRESAATYTEDLAGYFPDPAGSHAIPTRNGGGTRFFEISAVTGLTLGVASATSQAMCFRVPLTKRADLKKPIVSPPGYDVTLFAYLAQQLTASSRPITASNCSFGKMDWNFEVQWEGSWNWVTMTPAQRITAAATIRAYQQGWLYFLQTDPSVPTECQHWCLQFGLSGDEFLDNNYWPREAYVRDWARINAQHIMIQSDLKVNFLGYANTSVAMGSYPIDCHNHRLEEITNGNVRGDGVGSLFGQGPTQSLRLKVNPYQIPFTALLPQAGETTNLLMACAIGSSAVAMDSIRTEPTACRVGSAAGCAAGVAVKTATALNSLVVGPVGTVGSLQYILNALGQVITYTSPDPLAGPDSGDDGGTS